MAAILGEHLGAEDTLRLPQPFFPPLAPSASST